MISNETTSGNESRINDPKSDTPEIKEVPERKETWCLHDFNGFLHVHSWEGSSCGRDTIDRIREASVKKTGLEYLGFSEHVGWPGEEYWYSKVKNEFETIDKANSEGVGPWLFKGIEVNVSPDGTIDAEDDLMDDSDIVIGSIHYNNTDKMEQKTAASTVDRWCKMMDTYPSVNVLGHPLRDLAEEEWSKIDWDKLCQKAKEKNVIIEIAVSDHMTRDMPVEFLLALRKYDNLVSASADFHSIRTYLMEDGDLTDEQADLLKEFSKVKSKIAAISFGDEEKVKGSAQGSPEEDEEKIQELRALKARHSEIEDSIELGQIYDILTANVRYKTDQEGNVTAEKRPLSYKILRRFAKRINQLRTPISEEDKRSIVPSQNIINLWSKERIESWIKSRKQEIKIRAEL